MKFFILIVILLPTLASANQQYLEEAPLEWLITETLSQKITQHGHIEKDDLLVQDIFNAINYDDELDEIILTSNNKTFSLKNKLIKHLSNTKKNIQEDKAFVNWKNEKSSPLKVKLFKTNYKPEGHYYFNHVHTNISQDNDSLTWLKLSPAKTHSKIKRFLKNRNAKGTVAFTDHDTDHAYDLVSHLANTQLEILRGIEWGGATHMCLIGIKENWDNISNGREYEGEESIRQSRSSEGFRIVNHPNGRGIFPYTSWLDANGIEVWNTVLENSPFLRLNIKRSNNRDAFKQWQDSLKINKSYTAVAGSDFHFMIPCFTERVLAYPLNFIPASDNSNTKDYLMSGRSSFLTRPDSPKLTLQAKFSDNQNWSNMGDKIQGNGNLEVQLYGDFSDARKKIGGVCYNVVNNFYRLLTFWKKSFWQMRFYNLNGDLIAKRTINPKWYHPNKHFKATIELNINSKELVRAELWSINKKSQSVDLLGATNPIYINW